MKTISYLEGCKDIKIQHLTSFSLLIQLEPFHLCPIHNSALQPSLFLAVLVLIFVSVSQKLVSLFLLKSTLEKRLEEINQVALLPKYPTKVSIIKLANALLKIFLLLHQMYLSSKNKES